jgi:hypothetical protein
MSARAGILITGSSPSSSSETRSTPHARRGYVTNHEDRRGKPAKLAVAERLPDAVVILPVPDELVVQCSWRKARGVTSRPSGENSYGAARRAGGPSDGRSSLSPTTRSTRWPMPSPIVSSRACTSASSRIAG